MNTKASKEVESAQPADLRRKAEDRLRASEARPAEVTSVADARALVHELQVHQIELEMQNEELKRAQMEAEEASEKYYDLFDFAPAGHFLWDHEGRILEVNLAGAALLGLNRSAASQQRFGQFVASEYRGAFADFLKQVSATDLMQTCEVKLQRDGTLVWVLIEGIAAQDRQGPQRLCRSAVIDITQQKRADELAAANKALEAEIAARKQAEKALRASEEQFRRAIEDAPIPVIMHAEDGEVLQVSRTWTELTGYALADVPTVDAWLTRAYGEGAEIVRSHVQQLFMGKSRTVNVEFAIRTRDDEIQYWDFSASSPGILADGRRFVVGMAVDITDRKRMEEATNEAKAAAEAASEAKSRFLANISHELRTPMNAILGMVDLALPKQVDPAATDFLKTARDSADLLLALLNDLLDSAKIEAGKLELESAPFSLHRILDQTAQVLSVRASERGIVFSCRVSPEVPDALVGDQVRLRQVLLNLAGNGIKFTESGEVVVSVRVESQEAEEVCLEFAVQDTGIGIPRSDLESIFRPFTQADSSTTRRFGGTGLGLAICSSLVRMMGGRIWVESEPGHGSTFYFTVRMPLAKEQPAEPAARNVLASAMSPLRILLVEDNPANQKFAAYVLGERGHTVEIAGDGQQGLSMAQQNQYDVILMDVQMPGMDGLETTAAIRAREAQGKRTPIIAMTAHAMKGDRERCLAGDMDDYLSKPIDGHKMIALVESLAAGATPLAPMPIEPEPASAPAAVSFDHKLALTRCVNSRIMLHDMIQCFCDEVDNLLPQMRSALQKGDLAEVGRLGHRMKGTVVYLGAEPARAAAIVVERFGRHAGEQAEAAVAVRALEHECMVLKAALSEQRIPADPQGD